MFERFEKTKTETQPQEYSEELVTIESVESENAEYRLVKSVHIIPNTDNELGDPDIVVLETGVFHYMGEAPKVMDELEDHPQYKSISHTLKEKRLPVYFIDTPFKSNLREIADNSTDGRENLFADGSWGHHIVKKIMVAGALTLGGIKKSIEEDAGKITRRQFLKSGAKSIGGVMFLLSPLSNPLFDALERFYDKGETTRQELRKEIADNPAILDEMILAFRNAVIAEKLENIARIYKSNNGRKPKITVLVGGAHISLDEASLDNLLRTEIDSKTRMAIINKFLQKPYFAEHVADPKEIANISMVIFSDEVGKWVNGEEYNDPMLGGGRG